MASVQFKANTVNFIKELECDRCYLEILVFLLKNPDAEFTGRQIAAAISFSFLDVISSIGFLLNQRLLTASLRNDNLYYSLTADRSVRRKVTTLAGLSNTEWQSLLQLISCDRGAY